MKKLLSILSSISLAVLPTTTMVSCSSNKDSSNNDGSLVSVNSAVLDKKQMILTVEGRNFNSLKQQDVAFWLCDSEGNHIPFEKNLQLEAKDDSAGIIKLSEPLKKYGYYSLWCAAQSGKDRGITTNTGFNYIENQESFSNAEYNEKDKTIAIHGKNLSQILSMDMIEVHLNDEVYDLGKNGAVLNKNESTDSLLLVNLDKPLSSYGTYTFSYEGYKVKKVTTSFKFVGDKVEFDAISLNTDVNSKILTLVGWNLKKITAKNLLLFGLGVPKDNTLQIDPLDEGTNEKIDIYLSSQLLAAGTYILAYGDNPKVDDDGNITGVDEKISFEIQGQSSFSGAVYNAYEYDSKSGEDFPAIEIQGKNLNLISSVDQIVIETAQEGINLPDEKLSFFVHKYDFLTIKLNNYFNDSGLYKISYKINNVIITSTEFYARV